MSADQSALGAAEGVAGAASGSAALTGRAGKRFWPLFIGCIGVVYGDIGTSPIYALRESLSRVAGDGPARTEVLGVVSLLLWSLILIVTVKYVLFLSRADNRGEGGTLSLAALAQSAVGRRTALLFVLGIAGAGLFFGDAMITPAISVLSAIEGLRLVTPVFTPFILPITLCILIVLFSVQSRGTGRMAALFGPVTSVWFLAIATLGLRHVSDDPLIFAAFLPNYGIGFLIRHGFVGFQVLGLVFLAVTGAEALYADLGHFGRAPIRSAWLWLVFPALALNYLGQGALVLRHPEMVSDPFFLMCPKPLLLPLVILATLATIIASQAVITGAFSLTQQAVQLGLVPRLEIRYMSATQRGQIYMPRVNSLLFAGVMLLVVMFQTSSRLAAAYGIAVTGTMLVTTALAFIVMRRVWRWPLWASLLVAIPFVVIEGTFCGANLLKVTTGGYVPLLIGAGFMTIMWTWAKGTRLVLRRSKGDSVPLIDMVRILDGNPPTRVAGTAVFLTADPETTPPALLHNLKHNKVLHERNVIVSVESATRPRVLESDRAEIEVLSPDFIRLRLKYGYMETPDLPEALRRIRVDGQGFDLMTTSFFLARRNVKPSPTAGMPKWQGNLYVALSKESASAPDFFRIPPGRVIELGQQIVV